MRVELAAYLKQISQHLPAGRTFTCQQALQHLLEQSDHSLRITSHFEQPGVPALILYRDGIATGYVFISDQPGSLPQGPLWNVLHTDYLSFHHRGQTARLGTLTGSHVVADTDTDTVETMLKAFVSAQAALLRTADSLAQNLGEIAALLREGLWACLDENAPDPTLMAHWQVWEQAAGWSQARFADEYAQAIAFSLVSARLRHDGPARQGAFTLRDVAWDMPPTNPLMRDLIRQIDDDRVVWRIDALVALLARADITAIRADIDRRVRAQDPLGPLYQTFMRHYAPDAPAGQTPEALAIYLAEGVHYLLRKRFKRTFGLADDQIQIIDPATADGTALFFIIQRITTALRRGQQLDGAWNAYAADSLLPRLYGFDRSLAVYALTHVKIALQLGTTGYHFDTDQRLQVYLTGRPTEPVAGSPAHLIQAELRHDLPSHTRLVTILSAARNGDTLLPAAQQTVSAAQGGVVALVFAADFADGSRYAALRKSLLRDFSDLYVLQLPDLTIGLFARRPGWGTNGVGRVRWAAAPALDWLADHTIPSTPWLEVQPHEPDNCFVPSGDHPLHSVQMVDSGWRLDEIMPEHTTGLSAEHTGIAASAGSVPILYHPFDLHYITSSPGTGALRHLLRGDNLALCANDSAVFCTDVLPHANALGSSTQVFPLYVYPETPQLVTDSPFAPGTGGRRPNLDTRFILHLANRLDLIFLPDGRGDLHETFGPEDVFNALVALLSGSSGDPQHVPSPKETRQFRFLARRGRDLARYHRLHRPHNWSLITGFHGTGDNRIDSGYPRYIELAGEVGGRIYINKNKFFTGVERHLWETKIGEVQVLYRWLTTRAGYNLGWPDVLHYQRVIVALTRIANTRAKIDRRLRDS